MRVKATLPVFLLLLVFGQMSAVLCRVQCEGMATMASACGMSRAAQGHCAMCKHTSSDGAGTTLSAPGTGCGQICGSVLGLPQNGLDKGLEPLVAGVALGAVTPLNLTDGSLVRYIAARSIESSPPFDPLNSTLRI